MWPSQNIWTLRKCFQFLRHQLCWTFCRSKTLLASTAYAEISPESACQIVLPKKTLIFHPIHPVVCHNIRNRKSGNNPVVTLLRKYKSSTNVKHTLAKTSVIFHPLVQGFFSPFHSSTYIEYVYLKFCLFWHSYV